MEALTRLVTESLARHGFDRPLDYRRLQWSRWFRCESPHSLLLVPSKPGVFAVAEEVVDFSAHVATGVSPVPRSEASGPLRSLASDHSVKTPDAERPTPDAAPPRRMLAVTQFFEDDDMAFVLDRMLSRQNPMSARLITGRYFVRFVVVEDQSQRRSICSALNQWMTNAAEKATGIGSHFATSLELTPATEYVSEADDEAQRNLFDDANPDVSNVARTRPERESKGPSPASAGSTNAHVEMGPIDARMATGASPVPRTEASGLGTKLGLSPSISTPTAPHLDSGAAINIHCPSPLPSGF